jgi:GNAT superfamily N-acetyltransferase
MSVTDDQRATWRLRTARPPDAEAVAGAVHGLLVELGARPPPVAALVPAARRLLDNDELGAVVLAEAPGGALIGVLAASWVLAVHARGTLAVIQDLWVAPEWRGRAVGHELVEAIIDIAATHGIDRIEVGIPRDDFPALEATRRFYERNGFAAVGARLRREAP